MTIGCGTEPTASTMIKADRVIPRTSIRPNRKPVIGMGCMSANR
jgi:hypothetical protein